MEHIIKLWLGSKSASGPRIVFIYRNPDSFETGDGNVLLAVVRAIRQGK
jgi:hypothetical protein